MSRLFVLVAALAAAMLAAGNASADSRPNVLWIIADDHSAFVYGAYGNDKVRTPNLDRLARSGMRFERAYCNSPVCTASRQSLLTGRYPRTIGVTQLRTPLPEAEATLAETLAAAGYHTAALGKMHFNSDLAHGFLERIDAADHRRYLEQVGRQPLPDGVPVLPPWRPFMDPAATWLNGFYRPLGSMDADMRSTFMARRAAQYLDQPREQPFFLVVSFTEPHSPFHFPVEFAGRHDPATFPVPSVAPPDEPQIPEIFRDLTPAEKQGIAASYYTSVEFLDLNVGRVLDALERSGHADDTLVVYLGDHGYMLGEHGRFEKHTMFEPAVRAPLVISYPPLVSAASTTKALVEFVDVVPTVLDVCDVDVPSSVQGRSLEPLLAGKADEHRDAVFVEYAENEEAMVRTHRWKLVYSSGKRLREDGYQTGRPLPGRTIRLYDVEADPDELCNLADDPAHQTTVERLLDQLLEHLVSTARQPAQIPETDDRFERLDFCVQPHDVTADGPAQ